MNATPHGGESGIFPGLHHLDEYFTGCDAGALVVCASRPGIGKTSFAMNVALDVCRMHRTGAVVFSLELPKVQLTRRLLASQAGVSWHRLRNEQLSLDEQATVKRAAAEMSELPLWIDDTQGLTMIELRTTVRRIKADRGLALVVVDYIQLMRSGTHTKNRTHELREITRSLKELAVEFRLTVMILSQLNRDVERRGKADKRPRLSDLDDGDVIGKDADAVLFIYRDEIYDPESRDRGIAEIIFHKPSVGHTGTVRLRFPGEFGRFENLAPHH